MSAGIACSITLTHSALLLVSTPSIGLPGTAAAAAGATTAGLGLLTLAHDLTAEVETR